MVRSPFLRNSRACLSDIGVISFAWLRLGKSNSGYYEYFKFKLFQLVSKIVSLNIILLV